MKKSKLMACFGIVVAFAINISGANAQSWYGDYRSYDDSGYCPYSDSQLYSGYSRFAGASINYRHQFASCPDGAVCPYELQRSRADWSNPYLSRIPAGQCRGCQEPSFDDFADRYRSRDLRRPQNVLPYRRGPDLRTPADQIPRLDNLNDSNLVPPVPPTSPTIGSPPQLSSPSNDNSNSQRLDSGVAQGPPPSDLMPPSLGSSSSQIGHANCEHCTKN